VDTYAGLFSSDSSFPYFPTNTAQAGPVLFFTALIRSSDLPELPSYSIPSYLNSFLSPLYPSYTLSNTPCDSAPYSYLSVSFFPLTGHWLPPRPAHDPLHVVSMSPSFAGRHRSELTPNWGSGLSNRNNFLKPSTVVARQTRSAPRARTCASHLLPLFISRLRRTGLSIRTQTHRQLVNVHIIF